mmetsp:Transcript_21846/g.49780  ORF Transcript_21846/g.49780 Transcript_21846/m.49780 type:complete len:275 (+) Transcript_21846:77-901(+)
MKFSCIVSVWVLSAVNVHALHLTVNHESSVEEAYVLAEHQDQEFMLAQWSSTERELNTLQQAALDSAELAKNISASNATATADQLKKLMATSGVAGKTMLAPALEMLKGLYDDQKRRIADVNKREEVSKQRFDKQKQEHDKQIARLQDLIKNHKVSEGLYQNSTKDADRMFTYWQRCRERNHHQFHTNLKITHAMMEKVKHMISAYEKALAEPKPTEESAREAAKITHEVMPEIVFMQEAAWSTVAFCQDAMGAVKAELRSVSAQEVNPQQHLA